MSDERVVVTMDSRYRAEFRALPENGPEPVRVRKIDQMTPYAMMLAGLGSCTAIVLHTFAANHGIALERVRIDLRYGRDYRKDCEQCSPDTSYTEKITKHIELEGSLTDADRKKLHRVAEYCPIRKILANGIEVENA
ncbi:MAG: OsmC family peroxiredoxin [Deltaproteobacteria bacterium]|nr:MAG: OsmC family peroxiredoxin [Deltaproteobacteria bacterium]